MKKFLAAAVGVALLATVCFEAQAQLPAVGHAKRHLNRAQANRNRGLEDSGSDVASARETSSRSEIRATRRATRRASRRRVTRVRQETESLPDTGGAPLLVSLLGAGTALAAFGLRMRLDRS